MNLVYLFSLLLCLLSFPLHAAKYTVGTSHFYPPFVMKASNDHHFGYDMELADHICKALEGDCEIKSMTFDNLQKAVLKDEVDFAIAALTVTKAREQFFVFSVPYLVSEGRLLVRSKIDTKVIKKDFLNNKRIGIEDGTIYQGFVEKLAPKNAKLLYLDEVGDLVKALIDNKVDVVILDNATAIWWSLNSSNLTKVAGRPFRIGRGYAVAVAKKSVSLLPKINQTILKLQEEGTSKKMYEHYFGH